MFQLTRSTRRSTTASKARRGTGEATGGEARETARRWGRTAHASGRTAQADGKTPASGFTDARAGGEGRSGRSHPGDIGPQAGRGVGGWGTIHRARDDVSSTYNRQTKRSLLFGFDEGGVGGASGRLRLALDATELFRVGEDEVHVLSGDQLVRASYWDQRE